MMQSLLFGLSLFSGFLVVVSGVWLLIQGYLRFRANLTQSLNQTLDVIKVVKPKSQNGQSPETKGAGEKEEISKMEQLLASLSDLPQHRDLFHRIFFGEPHIALEIAVSSDSESIIFYVAMPARFKEVIEKQIHSFYPSAHIESASEYTIFRPDGVTVASRLKLKRDDSYPIRTYKHLESDPLQNIANALSKLEDVEEGAAIQIIIRRSGKKWKKKGIRTAQGMQQGNRLDRASSSLSGEMARTLGSELAGTLTGKNSQEQKGNKEIFSLTPEEQEIITRLEAKAKNAHFEANVRLVASAATKERAEMILASMENAFVQFEDSSLNKFVAIRNKTKNAHKIAYDYIFRNFSDNHRMILDTEELASIFHFPISTTETPKINWLKSRIAPPPTDIPKEGLVVGFSDFRGSKTEMRLSEDDRRRHLYIIGQTGTGKSTFIEEMAKQDAEKSGMCVIDPHGDLIDHILENIPKERAEDVVYFDPSDMERPFSLNIMEYDPKHPEQKTFVINETLAIFDKLYDLKATGGPMFEQYMRNAMLLVMDSPEIGSTLMEVPRVFRDLEFRKEKLARCKDATVVDFWEKEAEKAGGDAALENIAPYITSKLTTFISNDIMRPIISQQNSTFDFRDIMDKQKILLVNLSKGKIGEINSHLLGMIIVGKLLMAALSRVDTEEKDRKDFYLYIDEFQNFTTDSISQILAEARKYRLALIIAHQFIGQLSDNISKAVFGNVGSICAFRVGSEDADFLEKQFAPEFDASDLINVANYQCFAKLLINNRTSSSFDMKTYPPTHGNIEMRKALKELSRYKYGRDREIVEAEIRKRAGLKDLR
jgi:hypothetical protein